MKILMDLNRLLKHQVNNNNNGNYKHTSLTIHYACTLYSIVSVHFTVYTVQTYIPVFRSNKSVSGFIGDRALQFDER